MSVLPLVLAAASGLGGDTPTTSAGCDTPPGSRYYMLLFGGQSVPFQARTGHTWATWVKATPVGSGAVALEAVTISWLPADGGEVHPLRLRASVGRNWTLPETLAIMSRTNSQVSVWGPYETDADRYGRAVAQARLLESGAVRFRSLDSFTRRRDVAHCVHALTYADPFAQKYIQPVLRVGEPGTSRLATKYLRGGAFPRYPEMHDWLLPALGLDQAGLIRREPGERIPRRWR